MKTFFTYWLAALKLTKAQAFALFYRFVRYAAGEEDEGDD
jgi:hypothetical protein